MRWQHRKTITASTTKWILTLRSNIHMLSYPQPSTARHFHMKFSVHIKHAGLCCHSHSPSLLAAWVVSIIHHLPSSAIYTSFYSQSAFMLCWLHLSTPVQIFQPVHTCSFESPLAEMASLESEKQWKCHQSSFFVVLRLKKLKTRKKNIFKMVLYNV